MKIATLLSCKRISPSRTVRLAGGLLEVFVDMVGAQDVHETATLRRKERLTKCGSFVRSRPEIVDCDDGCLYVSC